MERRAQEIQAQIDGNAQGLDIAAANIELRGIMEAKENAQLRSMSAQQQPHAQAQGMNMKDLSSTGSEEPTRTFQ